jgi:hypothetical protein
MAESVEELEATRTGVLKEIEQLGDMRRGSIAERYRQCGKHPCCCEQREHPGHGPYYSLSVKTGKKTVTRHLAPGPVLTRVRQEIAAFRKFERLVPELVAVNEAICEARPIADDESAERLTVKKKLPRSSRRRRRAKPRG